MRSFRPVELILYLAGALASGSGAFELLRFHQFQAEPPAVHLKRPKTPVIGQLDIPRLRLSIPILADDNENSLALSVGHIAGTSAIGSLGNAGIAGHRDTSFRPLKDIRIGDRIETHTGQDVSYIVDSVTIVKPTDTSLLHESLSPLLTLVTCYPFNFVGSAPLRIVIQARMVAD